MEIKLKPEEISIKNRKRLSVLREKENRLPRLEVLGGLLQNYGVEYMVRAIRKPEEALDTLLGDSWNYTDDIRTEIYLSTINFSRFVFFKFSEEILESVNRESRYRKAVVESEYKPEYRFSILGADRVDTLILVKDTVLREIPTEEFHKIGIKFDLTLDNGKRRILFTE